MSPGINRRRTISGAVEITYEPGNATRYHLIVVPDPAGGLLVAWPELEVGMWASKTPRGPIRVWSKVRNSVTKADLEAIRAILDGHLLDEVIAGTAAGAR